jgi:peptide/nickel transport system ATP-binding protein
MVGSIVCPESKGLHVNLADTCNLALIFAAAGRPKLLLTGGHIATGRFNLAEACGRGRKRTPRVPTETDDRSSNAPAGAQDVSVLEVEDLHVTFASDSRRVHAVSGMDFRIARGETLALVGESGSGKSVTALSILRLLPPTAGWSVAGRVRFEGQDLLQLSEDRMRAARAGGLGIIFQEPMTSLNPVIAVGEQISERLREQPGMSRSRAARRAVEMLERVRIPEPGRRAADYPHQMSGGMRQRVMIAMALACGPKLLIADEPTTALDVTIQAQILDLMRDLQAEFGMAILFITHDLGVVAEMADRVVVMYAGKTVEQGEVREIFSNPRMPYTRALLRAIPRVTLGDGPRVRLDDSRGGMPEEIR